MRSADHERHEGDWHEWSTDTADEKPGSKPQRMFVRVDHTRLITVTESLVTSGNPGARELDGGEEFSLMLNGDLAKWLRDALTRALRARGDE